MQCLVKGLGYPDDLQPSNVFTMDLLNRLMNDVATLPAQNKKLASAQSQLESENKNLKSQLSTVQSDLNFDKVGFNTAKEEVADLKAFTTSRLSVIAFLLVDKILTAASHQSWSLRRVSRALARCHLLSNSLPPQCL